MQSPLYSIRQATPEDLPHLLLLERLSQTPDNWNRKNFRALLSAYPSFTTLLLFSPTNFPIAYLASEGPHPLFITTHPSFRRQGFASLLFITHLALHPSPLPPLTCPVRESDLPAQLFLSSLGFLCVAISPLHYTHPPEDGYVFTYRSPLP